VPAHTTPSGNGYSGERSPALLTAVAERLGRDTALFTTGSVATLFLGLVNVAVLTRFISPSDFGRLALLLFFAALLTVLYNLGSLQGAFNFVFGSSGEEEAEAVDEDRVAADKRAALGTALLMTAALSLAGTALVVPLAAPLSELILGDSGESHLVVLAAVSGGLGAWWRLLVNIPRLERRPVVFVVLSNLRVVFVLAVTIPLVVDGGDVEGALIGTTAGTLAALLVGAVVTRKSFILAFSRADATEIVRMGGIFVPVVVAFWVVHNGDLFILSRFVSDEDVGIYRVAWRIASIGSYFVSAFLMAWAPLARTSLFAAATGAGSRKVEGPNILGGWMATYFALTSFGLVLTLAVGADTLVRVAGPSYSPAAPLIPLLGLSFAAYGGFIVMFRSVRFPGRQATYVRLAVCCALIFLVAAITLIPAFGVYGAAVSPLIGFGAGCAGIAWLGRRSPFPTEFGWSRIVTAGALALTLLLAEKALATVTGPGQPAIALLALLLYPVALVGTGVVPRSHLGPLSLTARALLPWWSPPRGQSALESLDAGDRALLASLLGEPGSAGDVASVLGVTDKEVHRRLVAALRRAGGLVEGSPDLDASIGAYLLSREPVAERDARARGLWAKGVQPAELDALESGAEAFRRTLPSRAARRFRGGAYRPSGV
jgi:O-antigen/teichoic acid export membrane protein